MQPKIIISLAMSFNPSSLINVDEWFGYPSQKSRRPKAL